MLQWTEILFTFMILAISLDLILPALETFSSKSRSVLIEVSPFEFTSASIIVIIHFTVLRFRVIVIKLLFPPFSTIWRCNSVLNSAIS